MSKSSKARRKFARRLEFADATQDGELLKLIDKVDGMVKEKLQ